MPQYVYYKLSTIFFKTYHRYKRYICKRHSFMVVVSSPHDHIIPLWDRHRSSLREYRVHQMTKLFIRSQVKARFK
jgi:hypothetical protein